MWVVDVPVVPVHRTVDVVGGVEICITQTLVEHLRIQIGSEQVGFPGSDGFHLCANPFVFQRLQHIHTYIHTYIQVKNMSYIHICQYMRI